jgi:hypothetical protein
MASVAIEVEASAFFGSKLFLIRFCFAEAPFIFASLFFRIESGEFSAFYAYFGRYGGVFGFEGEFVNGGSTETPQMAEILFDAFLVYGKISVFFGQIICGHGAYLLGGKIDRK